GFYFKIWSKQIVLNLITLKMFQNPFSLNGRIRRLEYGLSYLIYCIYLVAEIVILTSGGIIKESDEPGNMLIFYLVASPAIWFLITQGAKRCHDRNNSGWWQLIPFYGFWMLFADGDIGPNDY